ncbi:hypothetical protein MYU51_006431 [Penicillium brevicompactum]
MCRPLSYMWYDLRADEPRDHPEYVEQGPPPMIEALHLRLKDSSSTHVTPKELEGFIPAMWHEPVQNLDHEWYIDETLDAYTRERPDLPHLIGVFVCGTNPDRDAQSLSVAELEAIGAIMVEQMWHGQHAIYPLLLLSFIGYKHGRITQAVHWGTELHVQFSQLLSFESEGNELMELFCRYATSDMVGCEQSPLSISISGV